MQETVINGIVLVKESFSNENERVKIFSQNIGLFKAYVRSGAKMKSKLSPHLEPLTLSEVRLVKKHGFTVTDAFLKSRFEPIRESSNKLRAALDVIYTLESLLPQLASRKRLWNYMVRSFSTGELKIKNFLKKLGYDPALATCFDCRNKQVKRFFPVDQIFFCQECSNSIPSEKTVKIR